MIESQQKQKYSAVHSCPKSEENFEEIRFYWSVKKNLYIKLLYLLIAVTNGTEDENVAVDDDNEWYKEDKGEEQHCVCPNWGSKGHVIPRTRSHETFWNIST